MKTLSEFALLVLNSRANARPLQSAAAPYWDLLMIRYGDGNDTPQDLLLPPDTMWITMTALQAGLRLPDCWMDKESWLGWGLSGDIMRDALAVSDAGDLGIVTVVEADAVWVVTVRDGDGVMDRWPVDRVTDCRHPPAPPRPTNPRID